MATYDLQIEKMHCGACVRRVTQTLNGLASTHANSVQIGAAKVTTEADLSEVLAALGAAGFPAHVASAQS
jgi:copper chaperone